MRTYNSAKWLPGVILPIGLSLVLMLGCGYRVRGTGEPVGAQIPSLAIPLMDTPSSSLGIEADFTRMIREEFVSHADLPIVSREAAAVLLLGRVLAIRTEPYTYRITETFVRGETTEYELTDARWLKVRLDARLVDKATGRVIWEDRNMREKEPFNVSTDPLMNRDNKRRALKKIARVLARRIYLKTMERF
jgi:hypothetical protein